MQRSTRIVLGRMKVGMYDKEVEKRDGFRGVVERYWSSGGLRKVEKRRAGLVI